MNYCILFSMQYASRVQNLQHVSRELDTRFLELAHREQVLQHSLAELTSLRGMLHATQARLQEQQAVLAEVTQRLPTLARTEALTRVQQRLDASPFEHYAQSPVHPVQR